MFRWITRFALVLLGAASADAREATVATWNLGWHLSQDQAATWIAKCSAPFAKNAQTGLWEPAAAGTPGWELKWGRDAPILWDIGNWPPCDVFQSNFDVVPVTAAAYEKRADQVRLLLADKVKADIIAFQEVSGEQAIRDVLPDGGKDYLVWSFDGFKIQRLGFAWRKELGPASLCAEETTISLPQFAPKDQVRPGLSLGLTIGGKKLRLLNVHLKSSCVTPVEAEPGNPRGALAGDDPACQVLQQQVSPLEAWIETAGDESDYLIILGDFNRAIWHELHRDEQVRTDGSDPVGPLASPVSVNSLIEEINDGKPVSSKLTVLEEHCPLDASTQAACVTAENPEDKAAWRASTKTLAGVNSLGCRNPVGLDHIVLGPGLTAGQAAVKVPLGRQGRTLPANQTHPNPLLALSDHCPLAAVVHFPD
ncbi:endonuclease/exonuclease/phosphatase family protein [Ancylobacter sp. SL191]|uniref:endonuclease/exonuclease/phosphatase family protein n=1 Tax=Ancylobacter sp. SL191 TaxID=2995166 RepID=UPI00227180D7|nr:endonuclease/exonuclease/phosphatase family protein [Ancylobacter sp. SL191]WAC27884.1 endonuclease/exonuclease/phosphatase family protein [Ancylobacter sp. SL191]